MKKYIIRLKTILLFIYLLLQSFNSPGQVKKFGIKAGANITSFSSRDSLGMSTKGSVYGYHVGAHFNLPYRRFLVQPGLLFISKGGYQTYVNNTGSQPSDYTVKYYPKYLEVPVNIFYVTKTAKGGISFGTGAYFAYAIGGTAEGNGVLYGQAPSRNISKIPFGEDVALSSWDYGVNGIINFELASQLGLSLNYSYGLSNINPDNTVSNGFVTNVNNRNFGISATYNF